MTSTSVSGSPCLEHALPPAGSPTRSLGSERLSRTRPGLVTPIVIFLLVTNAAGVAVNSHGAPKLVGAGLVLLLGIPLLQELWRGRPLLLAPATVPLILFLIVQLFSTMFAISPSQAFENVLQFVLEGFILFLVLTNTIRTRETLRRVLWAVMLAGAFLGTISTVQWITGTFDRPYGGFALIPIEFFSGFATSPRAAGPVGDPNYYAQILLIPVPLALFMLWTERTRVLKLCAFGTFLLCMAGIVLTFSRGAGLALVVTLLAVAVFRVIQLRYVGFVALGLAVAILIVPAYRERIMTVIPFGANATQTTTEAADVLQSRKTEMLAAAYVFADYPIAGVGRGLFPLYYQGYAARVGGEVHEATKWGENRGETPQREAHNMLVSVAAETGALGLLTFSTVVVVTLAGLLRVRRRFRGTAPHLATMATSLFLAIFAYVTAGLFLSLAYERYLWLVLALGAVPVLISGHDEIEPGPKHGRLARLNGVLCSR